MALQLSQLTHTHTRHPSLLPSSLFLGFVEINTRCSCNLLSCIQASLTATREVESDGAELLFSLNSPFFSTKFFSMEHSCNILSNISISHSLFLFLHVSTPLMLQSLVVVLWRLFLQRVCVCARVCVCVHVNVHACVSDPVFLSSLQSFSLHLVLIRTNTVEVSG